MSSKELEQPVEERHLRRVELLPCRHDPEPVRAVDLGEALDATAVWRPLQLEGVAGDRLGVEIALGGPGRDDLAALLADGAELGQRARRKRAARLLLELAPGAELRVLVLPVLALGDRPRPRILPRPQRPTRVDEQHLRLVTRPAVEEDAGAMPGHGGYFRFFGCRTSPQLHAR